MSYAVSLLLPIVYESGASVTTNDLERSLHSKTTVEILAHVRLTVVLISFVNDTCCIFRDIGPEEISSNCNDL